ncbi:MAG: hypothetical protein NXI24_14620 [bacterium]|nr:hypothetical protein [bacterium]
MSGMIRRIGVVFALTFQEARRRRLLVVFLVGCVVFMGSGSACTYGCRKLADSGVDQQRAQIEQKLSESGLSKEERAAKMIEFDELIEKDRESGEESLQSVLVALCFALMAFWIYLLAAFFTPFLALNDFFTGHHVLILSRPVKRWEYLFGKFAATAGMVLASMLLLMVCYLVLMKFSAGVWGWELLRGLAYILQGITVFILMLMFLTLTAGRLPAVFLSLLVVVLGVMPGYLIATEADLSDASPVARVLIYVLAYGLPQFSVNFVHGFAWMVQDMATFEEFVQQSGVRKIGNNSGLVSIVLNFVWIALLWIGMSFVFRKKELNT